MACHLSKLFNLQASEEEIERAVSAVSNRGQRQLALEELIDLRRFDPNKQPPPKRTVFSLAGISTSTAGNLTSINAHVKAGKTAVVTAQISSTMATSGSDTLGFVSQNPTELPVLYFDTEQSLEDFWNQVNRIIRRAGRTVLPKWLQAYCFTGFDWSKAQEAAVLTIERAAQQFGGIHSIHIDGVADLVRDVNDAAECNEFVARLHALAIQYQCPIVGVIHINPGSAEGKTRGHLGSQLERKAETNLRLEKEGEITEIYSEKQRGAPILKGKGPRFRWSDQAGMHVTSADNSAGQNDVKIHALTNLRDEAFGDQSAMRYSDLKSTLMRVNDFSSATAERKIKEMDTLKIIEKGFGNHYTKKVLQ